MERQREELLKVLGRADPLRVAVLAREHLWEFPDDEVVRRALAAHAEMGEELRRILDEVN
jgi:hypothetical protein